AYDSSFYLVDGNLVINYRMPPSIGYGSYQDKYTTGLMSYSALASTMYNLSYGTAVQGNHSYQLKILYPLGGGNLTLFSPYYGKIEVQIEQDGKIISPNSSASWGRGNYSYSFTFQEILWGNDTLEVESSIPYYSSPSMPAMNLSGYLAFLGMYVKGNELNGVIPGYLISGNISVELKGPFFKIPPNLPVLYLYLNPQGSQLYYPYFAAGGVAFVSMIIFAVAFLRRF
ncbi:MAG: hypothetical protein QW393_04020, partial [Candidatus Micrarchaeaceae archaeon]